MAEAPWKSVAAGKKARQEASIPKDWILHNLPPRDKLDVTGYPETCGLLSENEINITNTSFDALLFELASGRWTAVEVTTAFAKRAIIAHQLTNCLTEIFIERALKRAAELDDHLKTTGKVVGVLHGLPISLKDQINIKGIESTTGYVAWVGKFASKNAALVDILLSEGAVLYVKTNIPQTLMWPETFNHVFGRTLNPHNRSLTSGGSSGGEGALIALKGSPLGVGSDIGGSIRIPSAFNGLYGLRPSYHRIPYAGCTNSMEGQDSIPSVLGPISGSLSGVKAFMKTVITGQPWLKDALAVRKRWDEDEYNLIEHGSGKQLCFGILWDDGAIVPHPPIIRGLEETKAALLAAGHKVIDWKPLKHNEFIDVARAVWGAGATQDYAAITSISGEPLIASMSPSMENPRPGKALAFRPPPKSMSAYELWQVQNKKAHLRQEYLSYWQASEELTGTGRPIDALISPVAAYTAPPHGMNKSADYTVIWNALDFPALVIPISRVDPAVDVKKPTHQFYNDLDRENYELYEPERFRNAPITIQVVGRTLEEEAVIAISEIVDNALKANKPNLPKL